MPAPQSLKAGKNPTYSFSLYDFLFDYKDLQACLGSRIPANSASEPAPVEPLRLDLGGSVEGQHRAIAQMKGECMTIRLGLASVVTVMSIALATASTAALAGQGKRPPPGTPIPIPGPSSEGEACQAGMVALPGHVCWDPSYTGPIVPQGLTFVIPPAPGKLPKPSQHQPDSSGSCDASSCDCGFQ